MSNFSKIRLFMISQFLTLLVWKSENYQIFKLKTILAFKLKSFYNNLLPGAPQPL